MAACLVLAAAGPGAAQTASLLDTVLPAGHVFCDPPHPNCVFTVLQGVGIPAGIELENPLPTWPVPDVPFEFGGMTVRALLDKAIETDKRYEWREINGMPVMRPKEAWGSPRDPLLRPLAEPFVLKDVTLNDAIDALHVVLYGEATIVHGRPVLDQIRFSVRVSSGSLLSAVNAIALAHGRLTWVLATLNPDHPGPSFYVRQGMAATVLPLKPIDLQAEYVGKLKPDLQPSYGQPSCRLESATPAQIAALPVGVRAAKVMTGTLRLPWVPSGLAVALVEPTSGDPALYVDFDANGRWTIDERLASSKRPRESIGRVVLPSQAFIYQLPLPATSPWKFLPLIVAPGWTMAGSEAAPDIVLLEGGTYVEGSVVVDGRDIRVRYWDNVDPLTGAIDPMQGRMEMDTNADGRFDSGPYGLEYELADGKPVVFRVGTHYLSTRSADARTGTIVLREHPASDYTRIPFEVGLEVPDFSFTDFAGKTRQLSQFRGKHVLLDFWGTWCGPCVNDIPDLVEVYAKYRDRGFEILGMDDELTARSRPPKDPATATAAAMKLLEEKGATWPQVRTETAEEIAKRFRIGIHPTYILLDPQGRIVSWGMRGQLPVRGPKLADTLEKLLPPPK